MSQTYDKSIAVIEALSNVLQFSPDGYNQKFDEDADTLVAGANEIIDKYYEVLRTVDECCWLDRLLTGLLAEAPTSGGQKHVATVLHLVDGSDGQEGVIEVAKVWWERLICPILGDYNPTLPEEDDDEDTGVALYDCASDDPDEDEGPVLNFKRQVAKREQYRCAVTKALDMDLVQQLHFEGRDAELPPGGRLYPHEAILQVAHIIPFFPENRLAPDGTPILKPRVHINDYPLPRSFSTNDRSNGRVLYEREDVVTTWNLLRGWATGIDIPYLAGHEIHSPSNGICLNSAMQFEFDAHIMYFDTDAYPESPNKYKVLCSLEGLPLANGSLTADVEFPTAGTIPPPNPLYLKVHASMCKVLRRNRKDIYKVHIERFIDP